MATPAAKRAKNGESDAGASERPTNGTDAADGKKKKNASEDVAEDSKASSVTGLETANASAEASYDDLTGAAMTGLDAHAIEAEAELVKERAEHKKEDEEKAGEEGKTREEKLDDKKFKQLDALLDQTTIYSQFLSEQMDTLDEEEGGQDGSGKSPGGKGNAKGGAKKRKRMTATTSPLNR